LRKLSDALRPALVKRGKQRLLAGLKRSQPAGNDNYVALHLLGNRFSRLPRNKCCLLRKTSVMAF